MKDIFKCLMLVLGLETEQNMFILKICQCDREFVMWVNNTSDDCVCTLQELTAKGLLC